MQKTGAGVIEPGLHAIWVASGLALVGCAATTFVSLPEPVPSAPGRSVALPPTAAPPLPEPASTPTPQWQQIADSLALEQAVNMALAQLAHATGAMEPLFAAAPEKGAQP